MILNYGPRLRRFAYTPPEKDKSKNILYGSVRSGKNFALFPKMLYACRSQVPGWRLITGVTKETIFRNVLCDLFNLIGPKYYTFNHQSGLLRLFDSSWVVMGAKDEGSDKYVRGLTVGFAFCDELGEMPHDYFELLNTRLSPPGSRLYGTSNTYSPLHWLKQFIDNPEIQNDLFSMHCTMADNPNLTPEYIESQKRMYTGLFYERNILGHWVMAEGVIYRDVWSAANTFVDSDLPSGFLGAGGFKQRICSIDYGTTNPFVAGDWRDDGTTLWRYNEYRWDSTKERRQKTDAEYAKDVEKFLEGDRKTQIIVDPSAASFKLELTQRGWWVTDAKNEVDEGIKKTASAFSKKLIRLHRDRCKPTIAELETYAWNPKKALHGVEEPMHPSSHGPDEIRYLVHTKIPLWRLA